MPLYEMQDVESGSVDEIYFPMAEAPEIGSQVLVGERPMVRIVRAASVQASVHKDTHIEALSLPRMQRTRTGWAAPSDCPWYPKGQKCNARGAPVFDSITKRDEFLAHSEGRYGYGLD